MGSDAEGLIEAGQKALEAGDWKAARTSFEAALERDEAPEALFGLGTALYWLTETEAAVRLLERAYSEFRRRSDLVMAAQMAIELSLFYSSSLGNLAAASGWLGRAARLVSDHDLGPLEGWVTLCQAALANHGEDPARAIELAREAGEHARATGDGDLELCALAEVGASLVELGQLSEGLALLDEAMAGALGGEVEDLGTVVYASCRTIDYCARTAEFKRAVQWIRAADDFNRRYGSAHIHATCRTRYGALLFGIGRWEEAERELEAALRMSKSAEPAFHAEALAKLGELRLAEGRLEEAGRLLAGLEDHGAAALPLAQLHVARGELAVASSLLSRRLRETGEQCLTCAELVELQTEIEIERGEVAAAAERAGALAELGASRDCALIEARGARALGRALAATGERDEAVSHLERALGRFADLELALETSRTRLLLAGVLSAGEPEAAVAAGRAALASFEEVGAARDADQAAALLRSLGVKVARAAGPRGADALTKREREVLELLAEGLSNREIAERLYLSPRTVEHHVRSLLSKLELGNRAEAAAYAVRSLPERGSATN
ncbi:MAG TPA: LuxR C-terminal-related transcriptional regulator [Solirubrobacterales bacterium]|nr:LuxR C-terminal-related transcriptional regulator [Solirubrobacterales bacterium]